MPCRNAVNYLDLPHNCLLCVFSVLMLWDGSPMQAAEIEEQTWSVSWPDIEKRNQTKLCLSPLSLILIFF